jgi:hypothetical protein
VFILVAPSTRRSSGIFEFTRALHRFHQIGGDEVIEREFNAVCRAVWGYNLDDFTDEDLSPKEPCLAR